ncbi:MAG: GNAT family N-acetyltransferase [Saprospiraceae bacterium]|nr:GNAT family N-acetyltransferase [Saprospiraceae bacterium]
MQDLQIVKAEKADCPTLTKISKAAKAYWGYAQEWLDLWDADLTITPQLMEKDSIYKLVAGKEVLGFCVIAEQGGILEIEHLWIRPQDIGRGLGKLLLQKVLDEVITESHVTLSVVADPNATGFYEKFGLKTVEYIPSQPEGRQLPLMQLPLNV